MERAQEIQINAIDAALSSAVPPIEALPRPSRVPLSFPQEWLWLLSRLKGGSEACYIQVGLRFRGKVDDAALQSALDRLVARHEVLRTTFGVDDSGPFQRIRPADVGLPLKRVDLPAGEEVEATIADLMRDGTAAFDLEVGPLIRGNLVRLAVDDHMLLITMHQMVSDDWSRKILTRELCELYAAAREGRADRLTPLPVQYADYALWQRRWLTGEVLERQSEYWLRVLAGVPAALKLPTDRPRPAQQDYYSCSHIDLVLYEPLTTQLKALSRRHGTTLYVILLAGWALVLARLSGQDELVIGTPSANRTRSEIGGLIGLFVNTLTLRVDLLGDLTVMTLLQRVKAAALGAQANPDLPIEQVMERANAPRELGHPPTSEVIFAWQNNVAAPLELPGLEIEHVGVGHPVAQHNLALEVTELGEVIHGRLIYATSRFERRTVDRFASYLQQALSQMAANPGQRVWSMPLMSEEEHHRFLVESNNTEAAHPQDCIHDLAERKQEAIALLCQERPPISHEQNGRTTSAAPRAQLSPPNSDSPPRTAAMDFIEGTREVTDDELRVHNITRYHVSKFYHQQITNSGYYDQLKHIVEPSFEEFESPGNLDTSGEQDNTVVPGFQHKYAQTGLLLATDRCASYVRLRGGPPC